MKLPQAMSQLSYLTWISRLGNKKKTEYGNHMWLMLATSLIKECLKIKITLKKDLILTFSHISKCKCNLQAAQKKKRKKKKNNAFR